MRARYRFCVRGENLGEVKVPIRGCFRQYFFTFVVG